jgi:hypothetical protein
VITAPAFTSVGVTPVIAGAPAVGAGASAVAEATESSAVLQPA